MLDYHFNIAYFEKDQARFIKIDGIWTNRGNREIGKNKVVLVLPNGKRSKETDTNGKRVIISISSNMSLDDRERIKKLLDDLFSNDCLF